MRARVRLAPASLAIAAGLAAQTWFRPGTLIASGDNVPTGLLRPDDVLGAARWLWGYSTTPTGSPDFYPTLQTVPALFAKVLSLVGVGPHLAQRTFLTLLFVGMALAMFYFLATVLPARERLGGTVVGSLFYVINPSLFFVIPNAVILTGLVLLPLLPALIIRGGRSSGWKYPVLVAAASTLLSYAFVNPPVFALVVAASLVALVASWLIGPRREVGVFALESALLVVAANLWWIVPVAFTLVSAGGRLTPDADPVAWAWTHARSSIKNVLRLTPTWGWPRPEYFPYAPIVERSPFTQLAYLPPLVTVAAPFLVRGRGRRFAVAIVGTALMLVLLSKGLHSPLVSLNLAIYRHVPGMWLFREPAAKFAPLLAGVFAVGIALSLGALSRPTLRRATAVFTSGALLAVGFPIWSGAVVPNERPLLPSSRIRVPADWQEAARFINDRPGRTLLLPTDDYYQMPYAWGFYGADLIADELIQSNVIRLLDPRGNTYIEPEPGASALLTELRSAADAGSWSDAARLMGVLGVRWILVRRDIDWTFPQRTIQHPARISAALDEQPEFRRARSFGRLDLFELTFPSSPVWASDRAVKVADIASAVSAMSIPIDTLPVISSESSELQPAQTRYLVRVDPLEWRALESATWAKLRVRPGRFGVFADWSEGVPVRLEVASLPDRRAVSVEYPQFSLGTSALGSGLGKVELPVNGSTDKLVSLGPKLLGLPVEPGPIPGSETTLTAGLHELIVADRDPALTLDDTSFEYGIWGALGDCNAYDSRTPEQVGIKAERVREGVDGQFALALSAREHSACVSQAVKGFDPGAIYRISLDYLRRSGAAPRLCLWQSGPNRCAPVPALATLPGWQGFEAAFRPESGTTGLVVYLYADGDAEGTNVLYDRINLGAYKPSASLTFEVPDSKVPLGEVVLDDKTVDARLEGPKPPVLTLDDPSFEAGTWGAVGDCNAYDSRTPEQVGIKAERVREGVDGQFALALSAREHSACVSQAVKGFDPGAIYRISLDYLRRSGAAPRLCLWQSGPNRCAPVPALATLPGWQGFEAAFRPEPGTTGLVVYLYADGHLKTTEVLYDRVRLTRIGPLPEFVAIEKLAGGGPVAPVVKATRVSPTRYEVEVRNATGPFLLAVNDTFGRGWDLNPDVRSAHVRVNGYSNGWIVDRRGDFAFSIRYRPQLGVDRARAISAVTWMMVLLAILRRSSSPFRVPASGSHRRVTGVDHEGTPER